MLIAIFTTVSYSRVQIQCTAFLMLKCFVWFCAFFSFPIHVTAAASFDSQPTFHLDDCSSSVVVSTHLFHSSALPSTSWKNWNRIKGPPVSSGILSNAPKQTFNKVIWRKAEKQRGNSTSDICCKGRYMKRYNEYQQQVRTQAWERTKEKWWDRIVAGREGEERMKLWK